MKPHQFKTIVCVLLIIAAAQFIGLAEIAASAWDIAAYAMAGNVCLLLAGIFMTIALIDRLSESP